jgi:hypothetical protein
MKVRGRRINPSRAMHLNSGCNGRRETVLQIRAPDAAHRQHGKHQGYDMNLMFHRKL